MRITAPQLKQIIFEEYLKEEGIVLDEDKSQELLDYIKGRGPKPDWYDQDTAAPTPPPPNIPGSDPNETAPIDIPSDDAPESEYSGFQDRSGPSDISDDDLVASISKMIKGRDPEQVATLFQAVFAQIPEVEIDGPESLYTPGSEGRPKIRRFGDKELNELKKLIREVFEEGSYHDFGKPAYDVMKGEGPPEKAPFHNFSDMDDGSITDDDLPDLSDEDLLDIADKDGIEIHLYLSKTKPELPLSDEERQQLIGAIKNV